MKIALCFLLQSQSFLIKESIWREWIEENKDIINVYICTQNNQSMSAWMQEQHLVPLKETIFSDPVITAYISILDYAFTHDKENKWFCLVDESCCPIVSPSYFRKRFEKDSNVSYFSWQNAWWDPKQDSRANLNLLSKSLWLANDPLFILTRENVKQVLYFVFSGGQTVTRAMRNATMVHESLFAIIFKIHKELEDTRWYESHIFCVNSYLSLSKILAEEQEYQKQHIDLVQKHNPYVFFLTNVTPEFPDEIIREYVEQEIVRDE